MQSSGHYRGRTCYSLTFTKVKLSRFQVWIVLIDYRIVPIGSTFPTFPF